jgi:hypothetical protein
MSVAGPRIEHMIEQRTRRRRVTDTSSAAQLLAAAKDRRRVADAAEAELLELACAWADAHPPESIHDAAAFQVPGTDHEEQISGQGCALWRRLRTGRRGSGGPGRRPGRGARPGTLCRARCRPPARPWPGE